MMLKGGHANHEFWQMQSKGLQSPNSFICVPESNFYCSVWSPSFGFYTDGVKARKLLGILEVVVEIDISETSPQWVADNISAL